MDIVKQIIKKIPRFNLFIQIIIMILIFIAVRSYQLMGTAEGVAPIINDYLLSGEQIDLKQYRGKPVLIHFWATWCPICEFENDNIDAIAKDHSVISVVYWPESEQQVNEYMSQQNLDMPVVVDDNGDWSRQYGIKGVPVSFILDPEGNIQFSEFGYTTELGLRLRLWWAGK